ncbi:hydroxyproline O-arabinosyltransferase 3-like isoform X2 [Henckelia pumila]|uniref:hydroxyproline O-arabinosyltransferase 3-like isoform X2 n=1 Tax=Henckelia pumila TaxID=405737 RepID=UPI003C6E8EEF
MISGRKIMGREGRVFLAFLFIGVFLLTYNFITMIIRYGNIYPQKLNYSERHSLLPIDPVIEMPEHAKKPKRELALFHIALTATDSPYSKWQSRVMYYWYMKNKDLQGSEMGKFTRVLHSGAPDNLMDEIPSFVVDPLPPGLDRGYIVLNRPWAFVQWLDKATIEEDYILMAEPDHIFLKPLPNLGGEGLPAAFPFFYIEPVKNTNLIRKYFPEEMGPVEKVDPIGNSPVIIKKELLEKIAPTWMNVSLKMKNDPETDKEFGWVLEMYGYAVASALHGVQHILRKDFMLQPPWDLETRNKFILHYTYGCDYDMKITLVKMVNEASANIPNWDTT